MHCTLAWWEEDDALNEPEARTAVSPSPSLRPDTMSALAALDELRRALLRRGCRSDMEELRLAATLSRVSKHLRDRNRQRCRGLLAHVEPSSLHYSGLAAVWEESLKHPFFFVWGPGEWPGAKPLSEWPGAELDLWEPGRFGVDLQQRGASVVDGQVHFLQMLGRSLTSLNLSECTAITAPGLEAALKSAPALKTLNLSECVGITGDGFAKVLRVCTRLVYVTLTNASNITSEAFESLQMCTRLESLSLGETQIADRGLEAIAVGCTKLRALYLWQSP